MADRKKEIRELLDLSSEEVVERAGSKLVVCEDIDALHQQFAEEIANEIKANNDKNQPSRFIMPVGPTGQYPILAGIINHEGISLANCWFFFMDEYCGENLQAIPPEHPLSFKGEAKRLFLDRLNGDSGLNPVQVIFPDETNIDQLAGLIEKVGGIDVCYGGIGIHGHVAFNEPEAGVAESGPRLVNLNDFTVTINAVRSGVGGNLECFPRQAYTIGMKQIINARKIRLYCRSGCEFDWANTVLRLGLFGTPGNDYPATRIQNHDDYVITTDRVTLMSPVNQI